MCVSTHCSNFPKSFVSSDVEISELDVLGETLGRERCFGAVKGKVAAGPMTRGHCADVLHEAVTRYLGWNLYYHSGI